MTTPLTPLPHPALGNIGTDVSGAAASFIAGLKAERERRQALAMQQALSQANIQHLGAESRYLNAETGRVPSEIAQHAAQASDIGAQATTRVHGNEPSGPDQLLRLQQIHGYEKATPAFFEGASRTEAEDFINRASQSAAMLGRSLVGGSERPYIVYDPTGAAAFARAGTPGSTPTVQPIPGGYGKPTSSMERGFAGAGLAAANADETLRRLEGSGGSRLLDEVSRAIVLPSIGRALPFSTGEAADRILHQLRLAGISPDAQEYIKRMFDFAGIVGPKRYGLRGMQSTITLQQLWTDFGAGQFGLTPEGINAAQKNRQNAILQFQTSAGPRAWQQGEQIFNPPVQQSPFSVWDTTP